MSFVNKDGSCIYDHFDKDASRALGHVEAFGVTFDADSLALIVARANYGIPRFFAALVRLRKAARASDPKRDAYFNTCLNGRDPIVDALEKLLNEEAF